MIFNLKQLEAFVWVADLHSFRRAAERLNTTQPNISSRISSLETVLNLKLMERDAGSVRLTSKGEELLRHAREVLKHSENLVSAADQKALFDGALRIGVTELIVHTWLREFLRKLKDEYPNVIVELTVDLSVNLKTALFSRSIDLVFQNGPFERNTTGSEDLGTYPWTWVAAPTLNIDEERHLSTEELQDFPILTHARDTKPFEDVSAHFSGYGKMQARLVPSSNLATCLYMALDGMGIAALPVHMVREDIKTGKLIEINYDWAPEPLEFFARYDVERTPRYVGLAANLAAETAHSFLGR